MSTQAAATAAPESKFTYENEAHRQADRDLCGRYAAGNPGGPGNPYARQTAAFKKAIHAATTPEEAQALARKIYEMGMAGNLAAAKLYFSYTAGKPADAADPDRVDVHEFQLYRDTAPLKEESAKLISAGLPGSHLHLLRTLRPMISALANKEFLDILKKPAERPAAKAKREAAEEAEMERILSSPAPELPDGLEEKLWPSTNGVFDELPSVIDGYGKPPASTNGKNGRAKRKKKGKRMPQPSTNGRFHFGR